MVRNWPGAKWKRLPVGVRKVKVLTSCVSSVMEQHTNDSSSSLLHRGGNSSQNPAWLILLALTSISFSCSCGVLFPRVRCLTLWPARSAGRRSEEHTSELQSLMRISYAVFCLKKKNKPNAN